MSQEFLPSLAWFHAWQVVFSFFFLLLFEDQTRRVVSLFYFIPNEFERSVFPVLSSPSSPPLFLHRSGEDVVDSSQQFLLIKRQRRGGRVPHELPFNFPRVFSPNYDPIHFSGTHRKREIDLEGRSQRGTVVFQREHNFTLSAFSLKKKEERNYVLHAKGKWLTKSR